MSTDRTCYSVDDTAGDGADWVTLIHGVGMDQGMWGGQVVGLADRYRVLTYDMLGHGLSRNPTTPATLEEYAEQLRVLLEELGITRTMIVGFSLGALVARTFAVRHPHAVRALMLMSSVFRRTPEQRERVRERVRRVAKQGAEANVEEALQRWFSREYRAASPAQVAALRERVVTTDREGYLRSYALFSEADCYLEERLGAITAPTLVLTGEHDVGSTPAMTAALAAAIPGARAEVVAGQRHMMPVEAPSIVNERIRGFLADTVSADHARTTLAD